MAIYVCVFQNTTHSSVIQAQRDLVGIPSRGKQRLYLNSCSTKGCLCISHVDPLIGIDLFASVLPAGIVLQFPIMIKTMLPGVHFALDNAFEFPSSLPYSIFVSRELLLRSNSPKAQRKIDSTSRQLYEIFLTREKCIKKQTNKFWSPSSSCYRLIDRITWERTRLLDWTRVPIVKISSSRVFHPWKLQRVWKQLPDDRLSNRLEYFLVAVGRSRFMNERRQGTEHAAQAWEQQVSQQPAVQGQGRLSQIGKFVNTSMLYVHTQFR